MRYVIDIDETICTYDKENIELDYSKAKPIKKRIVYMNKLYDEGNEIVYLTARGFVTKIDWTELTKKQFEEWGVKYHELYLTKPNGDIYIDDKAISDLDFFKEEAYESYSRDRD